MYRRQFDELGRANPGDVMDWDSLTSVAAGPLLSKPLINREMHQAPCSWGVEDPKRHMGFDYNFDESETLQNPIRRYVLRGVEK